MTILEQLCAEFRLQAWQVENTVGLIDEGNTIPFIARYRKEQHGELDDQVLRELADRLEYLRNLHKRKEEVRASIEAQEKLTLEIEDALAKAVTLAEIEDIYRPFKPKRRTRASIAKEKGLEPLALEIYEQDINSKAPITLAEGYINEELGVASAEEALQGASDIIAEMISDNANIRRRLRNLCCVVGELDSKAAKEEDSVYADYYDFRELIKKIADHRVLAINRGEREEFLKVNVLLDAIKGHNVIVSETLEPSGNSLCTETVRAAGADAYDRLIFPSIEREIRAMLTEKANAAAIRNFAVNLRELLLQPPVKGKVALGLDPGYRTGCKVAVVDPTGRVLDTGVIYVTQSQGQYQSAKQLILSMLRSYHIEIIAIGNGTASRETEAFAVEVLKEAGGNLAYMIVNEAGASVYSASKLAAEEFPQFDVSLRSAVSIARRLQDPLAELVKIEPKAIGVGQYQHDMPKKELESALGGVVEDCVNAVGADVNTASPSLLGRISGVNSALAKSIVAYREENGAFISRAALKKVPKLGAKAFEQCAGFLRVPESKNVLDNTGVHPESYVHAKALLNELGYSDKDIKQGYVADIAQKVHDAGGAETLAEKLNVGLPTLQDIAKELARPGRDPRDELPPPMLRTDVLKMEDLAPGMELQGTVRNVIDFGAFIDIGVHQDGLVHVSRITDRFIKHPSEILKVGQVVTVWVMTIDLKKQRIALTMKKPKEQHA